MSVKIPGMRLVPTLPTPSMMTAAKESCLGPVLSEADIYDIYRAMLAAYEKESAETEAKEYNVGY